LQKSSPEDFIAPPCTAALGFVFSDADIVVLEKPSGLLSVPGKHPSNKDSVLERLKVQYPSAKLVHRLDFGTSGLMVAALSSRGIAHLNQQFQERSIAKEYTAVLAGHLADDCGEISMPIARGDFPRQKICTETGKEAISHYQVLAHEYTDGDFPVTRVRYKPVTGRTHQLRIHSLEIGHPIVGCDLYNAELMLKTQLVDSHKLAKRLQLHASQLSFDHPLSGERMSVVSECPF